MITNQIVIITCALVLRFCKISVSQIQNPVCRGNSFLAMGNQQNSYRASAGAGEARYRAYGSLTYLHKESVLLNHLSETVRKSVATDLNQVEQELKQAKMVQQKPAIDALEKIVFTAQDAVSSMRREMSRYTWKSAIYLVMSVFFVMASCVTALTWFIDDGYGQIALMQAKKAEWQQKAPQANISTFDGKSCVQVTGAEYTDKKGRRFYQMR